MEPLGDYESVLAALRDKHALTKAEVEQALADHRALLLKEVRQMLEEQLASVAPTVRANPAAKHSEKINEDHLMIIGAIIACHFGKRAKVRSARRIMLGGGSNVWSQQGRAAVQASHSGLR